MQKKETKVEKELDPDKVVLKDDKTKKTSKAKTEAKSTTKATKAKKVTKTKKSTKSTKEKTASKTKKTSKTKKESDKGGRPTKYNKKYCKMLIEYFDVEATKSIHKKTYFVGGDLKEDAETVIPNHLPTFQGFANLINVNFDTLREWEKTHKEFSEAYTRAKELQEKIWLTNSLEGRYNAQFAIFFGKNCLGYTDKQEIEHNGSIKLEDVL